MRLPDQSPCLQQYRRMLRARDQLAGLAGQLLRQGGSEKDALAYEDAAINFLLHAWHLKDWIKNDSAVEQPLRDRVVSRVESDEVLQACADVANGRKHLLLRTMRIGAGLEGPGSNNPAAAEPAWEVYVTLPGGHRRDVPTAANVIVGVWDWILRGEGLLQVEGAVEEARERAWVEQNLPGEG